MFVANTYCNKSKQKHLTEVKCCARVSMCGKQIHKHYKLSKKIARTLFFVWPTTLFIVTDARVRSHRHNNNQNTLLSIICVKRKIPVEQPRTIHAGSVHSKTPMTQIQNLVYHKPTDV